MSLWWERQEESWQTLQQNFIPFVPAVSWEAGAEEMKKKPTLSFYEVSYGIRNAFYSAVTVLLAAEGQSVISLLGN